MKLKVLGAGSAFATNSYNTMFLIEDDDKKNSLLFDCGGDTKWAFHEAGITPHDIKNVYVTHLHGDHSFGLEFLGFKTYFDPFYGKFHDPKRNRIKLYAHSDIVYDLWHHLLCGPMRCVEGRDMHLDDYFEVKSMYTNRPEIIEHIGTINTVQTVHIMHGNGIVNTFGLMLETSEKKKLYMTSDTQFCPDQIVTFYSQADIIIQDCDISSFDCKVHANYKKLVMLAPEIKAKMYLAHYTDDVKPDAIADGFLGFLEKGQEISI